MEADFSGYATKAGLKCTDGRTIMPDAFKHQDKVQVPLVWQHGHDDPENVLGHVILENRDDGVYCHAYFNNTTKAQHAREMVQHKDINSLSIWANKLIQRGKQVFHGAIREVSLVLSGANPGALIENITLRHSDGSLEELDDDIVIYSGVIEHADGGGDDDSVEHAEDKTIEEVYNSMSDEQKQVCDYLVGEAMAAAGSAEHSAVTLDDDATAEQVYETLDDKQKELLHSMLADALQPDDNSSTDDPKGTQEMKHNVFEKGDTGGKAAAVISHDDMKGIFEKAVKDKASLKDVIEAYAEEHLEHGIQDIDTLFPEATAISNTPELLSRRMEWVNTLMTAVRKSPFSRVKTLMADITVAEARAKGYIKGSLKKEEFFRVSKRVTTPQTVYKKQKLDRDDILDITDFDVVVWLKGEMRIMLDEEIARAILVGDGRAEDNEDKIKDPAGAADGVGIRSVVNDHELYNTTLYVNIGDANSNMAEVSDAIVENRSVLRGSGTPIMFTTETYIGKWMTERDGVGRKLYKDLSELASELRVKEVVPVEILEEYPDIVAVIFNPMDYVVGTSAGGQINMFDDFDIDFNQYKYLIETRCSGALVKLKAAMTVRKTAANSVLIAPAAPTFDGTEVTIVDTANVVYRNAETDAVVNTAGSPYAVADGDSLSVVATPAAGFHFESSDDDSWTFTNQG